MSWKGEWQYIKMKGVQMRLNSLSDIFNALITP
jgi:hypothetical protein